MPNAIKPEECVGESFGKLTIIELLPPYGKHRRCTCECECGTIKEMQLDNIRSGKSTSCGCVNKKIVSAMMSTHRKTNTRLYRIWKGMRERCRYEKHTRYKKYGGRGITVCDEWQNFQVFYDWAMSSGYTDDLTIDREDNDGNYEPSNCRWTNYIKQSQNKGVKSTNKSGVTGVSFDKSSNKWVSRISVNGRVVFLGRYSDISDAMEMRRKAELLYW